MNRKLILLGFLVSILSFLGCKPDNREIVKFNEFVKSPSEGVLIDVENEFYLTGIKSFESKTRLQSKTTTLINTDITYETSRGDVLIILSRSKRIEKHLKTTKERRPFVENFERMLLHSNVAKIDLSGMLFELDTYYGVGSLITLREVRR